MTLGGRTGPGGFPRSRLLRPTIVAAVAATIVVLAGSGAPASHGLHAVGELDRPDGGLSIKANGELIIDAAARRAYRAVFFLGTTITELDLDTLEPLRSVELPDFQAAFTTAGETHWLWDLDEPGRRIFSVVRANAFGGRTYSVAALDLDTFTYEGTPPLYPVVRRFPLAMSHHAGSDRLYLLSKIEAEVFGRDLLFVEERLADGTLVWEQPLPMCMGSRDHTRAPVVARSELVPSLLYLNCYSLNSVQSQVVRITLGADGRPEATEVFPAVPKAVSAMFDPGSDRIFFLTTNSNAGRGAWVFDGLQGKFLGVIASGDSRRGATDYSMGLDPATGRLYIQTPVGMLVSDARRTPLGAGLLFREYAGPGFVPIHVDPATKRVFAPDPASLNAVSQPQRYLILRDDIPLSQDPVVPDPDANTVDAVEAEGVTGVTFAGEASAFAARSLTTGGIRRAAWNLTIPFVAPENLQGLWDTLQAAPISNGNRDLVAARVPGVALTSGAADAAAAGATADDATRKDLEDRGLAWPFPRAECHDAGDEPGEASSTGARAECRAEEGAAEAFASAAGFSDAGGAVTAAALFAEGSVVRDAEEGTVAHATAAVRELDLFGRVRIGEVRAEARTRAYGRPGTAGASYVRSVADAWVDEDGDGEPELTCDVCDPAEVAESANRALTGIARISMPAPDPASHPEGSPGGYQAVVKRDTFDHYSARSMNDDAALEVPGIEIVIFSDGRAGRSRHVVQLAGVLAASRYGIFLLPQDTEPPPVVTVPPLPPPPPPPPPPPAAPVPAPPPLDAGGEPREIVISERHEVREGWRIALFDPREGALLGALWLFFLTPAALVARRRRLERLDG